MSRATSILARVDNALKKVTPSNRLLYKRVTTNTGDALIGRVTASSVDTLLDPQPYISQAGRQRLSGQRDQIETVNTPNGGRLIKDDYILTVSSHALSGSELQDKNLSFVFKDGGTEEQLFLMDYELAEFQGTVIVYTVYARSVKV